MGDGESEQRDGESLAQYGALLASIGERAAAIEPRPLASHWPHVGTAYRGLVIAGQALKGWDRAVAGARWRAQEAQSAAGRSRIIDLTRTWYADYAEPIAPIADLPNRSGGPFWQICADLVQALEPDGPDPWYSRFAWANVYPVSYDYSPTHDAQSPWGALKQAQDDYVGELFAAWVKMLNARRVIVVSGPTYWWAPSQTRFADLAELPRPLLRGGRLDGRTWVVGYHPAGARRRRYRAAAYARLIVDAVHALEAS